MLWEAFPCYPRVKMVDSSVDVNMSYSLQVEFPETNSKTGEIFQKSEIKKVGQKVVCF